LPSSDVILLLDHLLNVNHGDSSFSQAVIAAGAEAKTHPRTTHKIVITKNPIENFKTLYDSRIIPKVPKMSAVILNT